MSSKVYTIISNTCRGATIHNRYIKVPYSQPVMNMLFINDENYIKFCERYTYYSNTNPQIRTKGTTTGRYFNEHGVGTYVHPQVPADYPILVLHTSGGSNDVEIHCIHHKEDGLLDLYNRRRSRGKPTPIFTWTLSEMINTYKWPDMVHFEAPAFMVKRFCNIPNSIFIGNAKLKEEWGMQKYDNFIATPILDNMSMDSPRENWGVIVSPYSEVTAISDVLATEIFKRYDASKLV